MKKINKLIMGVGAALCLTAFTGCIDETEPTDVATKEQIEKSSSATDALLMAMPAYFNQVNKSMLDNNNWHAVFGYGAMMYIRDMETGDMTFSSTNYSAHWLAFYQNKYLGDSYLYMQYVWNYYYAFVLAANNTIGGVNPESATPSQLGALGAGYAFRALCYLDMARAYEYLPTDGTSSVNSDGHDVTNRTVPIITESTSQQGARNNPRATRDSMATFILSDLDKAEEYIVNLSDTHSGTLPDLSCVYGLKARLYMWIEDYANAQKYARLAIDNATVDPMTEDECLNTTTGFNDASKWMWGTSMTSEDYAVQTGIVNRVSWISNQTTFGYTGPATNMFLVMDKSMYERISDTDFRKLEFKAPAGSVLSGKEKVIPALKEYWNDYADYASIKFRPNAGDCETYSTGAAASTPIMRVEEMYFIEAEAAAHQNVAEGKQLLVDFMQTYRDPSYVCAVSSVDDVIEEIIFQKRVELWGEGQNFFDIKRLNYSVTRGYTGTNWPDKLRFNTNGRPAWMNWVIVRTEANNNEALVGWNNPDPSDCYSVVTTN